MGKRRAKKKLNKREENLSKDDFSSPNKLIFIHMLISNNITCVEEKTMSNT